MGFIDIQGIFSVGSNTGVVTIVPEQGVQIPGDRFGSTGARTERES